MGPGAIGSSKMNGDFTACNERKKPIDLHGGADAIFCPEKSSGDMRITCFVGLISPRPPE
jgi:hypothetical protein